MQRIQKRLNLKISALVIVGVAIVSFLFAFKALAAVSIVGATVTPGTIDISTSTNVAVSFTTPVVIPNDGEIVVTFPSQFGLQKISGVSSAIVDGTLTHSLVSFREVHIARSGGNDVEADTLVSDIVIANVTTPPIEDFVGNYTVAVYDANSNITASGSAKGQTFEDIANLPAGHTSLTLNTPNGGDIYEGKSDLTITWSATGGVPFIEIYFSDDGGASYQNVAEGLEGFSYIWTVPNYTVKKGKIKVVSVDENGAQIKSDISDSNFQITHMEEVIVDEGVETVIPHNSLIKGESTSAVYFFGPDLKRYVFPSEKVFYSWYDNFDDVITVSDEILASYKLGKRITIAPGSLIKINSDPMVYAIDSAGIKHHIKDEVTASILYGTEWATEIVDIDVTQWFDYPTGDQLTVSNPLTITMPAFPITISQ